MAATSFRNGRITNRAWSNRVTDWLWKNMPDARILPSGSVRFWFDAWHDLAELGGGSEQGAAQPDRAECQRRNRNRHQSGSRIPVDEGNGSGRNLHRRPASEEPYKDGLNQPTLSHLAGVVRRWQGQYDLRQPAPLRPARTSSGHGEACRYHSGEDQRRSRLPATLCRRGREWAGFAGHHRPSCYRRHAATREVRGGAEPAGAGNVGTRDGALRRMAGL